MLHDSLVFTKGNERIAKVEVKIRRQLVPTVVGLQMGHRRQRLLEVTRRLTKRRARECLSTCLLEVSHRLAPHLTSEGVVSEPLDVLGQTLGVERLDGFDNPGVERPSPLLEYAPVGNLVGEGVLEGVFEVREQARLVEKLGLLQASKRPPQCLVRQLRDRRQD